MAAAIALRTISARGKESGYEMLVAEVARQRHRNSQAEYGEPIRGTLVHLFHSPQSEP
jgi:hypothetical protein